MQNRLEHTGFPTPSIPATQVNILRASLRRQKLNTQAMATRSTLKEEVLFAVMRFQHLISNPFNTAELVVMALVCGHGTQASIFSWICAQFKDWSQLASTKLVDCLKYNGRFALGHDARMEQIGLEFDLLHRSQGVPVYKRPDGTSYYTTTHEARIFLGDHLNVGPWTPQLPQTLLRFFDLPLELRTMIYDMVFYISAHGVAVSGGNNVLQKYDRVEQFCQGMIRAAPDWHPKPTTRQSWEAMCLQNKIRYAGKVEDILAATRVNFQWHRESIPSFYKVNTFFCFNVDHLSKFLTKLPVSHRPHVRHISFAYMGAAKNDYLQRQKREVGHAFELLAQLPKLQTLNIDARSSTWRGQGATQFNAKGEIQRAGLKQLLKVKVNGQVTIQDALPAMEQMLKQALVRPKEDPVKKKRSPRKPKQTAINSAAILDLLR